MRRLIKSELIFLEIKLDKLKNFTIGNFRFFYELVSNYQITESFDS